MFGERIDYRLLRAMAHGRNRATEAELDSRGRSSLTGDEAVTKFPSVLRRFDGHLAIEPGMRYLDMGCGSGELTLELARRGATDVTGVDFLPRFVRMAEENAEASGLRERVKFICADLHAWRPPHPFDVVFSFDALEHIGDPGRFLVRMGDFLAPGGIAVISFGPLFHSPFGDHMAGFFRFPLPWRGALFSEQALLRVRQEMYRPTDAVHRLQDIAGGLNLMRYSEFLRYVREAGWRFRFLQTNAFLGTGRAGRISNAIARLPGIGDFTVHNVYAVLERAARETSNDATQAATDRRDKSLEAA